MAIKASIRKIVHEKYDGHCAYCGAEITIKEMHIDHIIPRYRAQLVGHDLLITAQQFIANEKLDEIDNLNPACRVCNLWKSVWTVEEFRHEIGMQIHRLIKRSAPFRLVLKYNLIKIVDEKETDDGHELRSVNVSFYFELVTSTSV